MSENKEIHIRIHLKFMSELPERLLKSPSTVRWISSPSHTLKQASIRGLLAARCDRGGGRKTKADLEADPASLPELARF